eukprot:CAMPEP_0176418618 /NCGR_PEP_ID=MMETSP0127-20121128/7572_1 /TAXON_ID=938130 /ORGANISM="Platyophrya macrostoma, Strain WH" /LENGTH=145 /DNA_ID=CAMNT_0017798965 /DNA_START=155 /DNA_END=592 /DNA_ORIENTATION=+
MTSLSPVDKTKKNVHVHIADATSVPEHTYVEKIHTPRRGSFVKDGATEAEWADFKHAHIDDDAVSPSGLVDRVQTPIATPSDRGYTNAIEEVEQVEAEEAAAERAEKSKLTVYCCAAFAAGAAVGSALTAVILVGVLCAKKSSPK